MKNPAFRAEQMIDAYREQFIGRGGTAARSVANRYEQTSQDGKSILNVRGPFLQALDIPNWSNQSWENFCKDVNINPLIKDAFSDLGFKRLYDFQERTVETVKQGEDTVVTAATGRGKTEAWLIPILDRILDLKKQEDTTSVKAMLIYPTKALAQDQFKRLVQYLYRINKKWPTAEQITIGIYDGDTPTNVGANAQGYLESSFKYFDCPGANEELEKCRNCGQGVRIHHAGQHYEVEPEKRKCTDDVPLDFIKLTKNQILNEGVDILLTNPDTINRKLININAPDEHDAFIYDPEFLVFDEVHTYDGLFGSYTASLTKRLRALRSQRKCGDLQLVASSATVDNDVELFRQVSGAKKVAHVDEKPRSLKPNQIDQLPDSFTNEKLSEEDLMAFARGERTIPMFSDLSLNIDTENHDDTRLRELVEAELFDYLTQSTTDPSINSLQLFHQKLSANPRPHDEVVALIQSMFDVSATNARTALHNFKTIGTFSGLLANRTHLFSWPIDGFYACASCDAVYKSPQESCEECGYNFVTRSTYCRGCDDEALVAWFCPSCDQMDPYIPSEEGDGRYEDEHYCQRCLQSDGEWVRTLRVTFHPQLACEECGHTETRSTTETCNRCDTDLVHVAPETLSCPNPVCEHTQPYQNGCEQCGGRQRPITGDGPIDCSDCGENITDSGSCRCGASPEQTRYLPWVCRNSDCNRTYFDDPPSSCGCDSSHIFARAGLFEIFDDTFCTGCDTAYLEETACECDLDESARREGGHQSFKTFEPNGKIRSLSGFRPAAPCSHQGLPYNPDRRYDELVRGPGNLAVTTAQYMLRGVADDEGYESAKMLSFADSHRDMKELDRDFREPEVGTLLDQCLYTSLANSQQGWVPLNQVLEDSIDHIEELHELLIPPADIQNLTFDLKSELVGTARRQMDPDRAIQDRLFRRAIPHRYNPRMGEYGDSLAENGVIDLRLTASILDELSKPERRVLGKLLTAGNMSSRDNFESGQTSNKDTTIESLAMKGAIEIEDGYVSFAPSALELTIAGAADNLQYDQQSESIEHTLHDQLECGSTATVPYNTPIDELADPSHPRFNARAFRTVYSEPRILLSRVYHGMTNKRQRREIEYLFREGNYPNFLSSGPTMELGVDIGALDALLLYGTPPNMNAYLQRIGRAGRSSNASLIHSVSQRNPIDYYYYDQPADLMAADPQPVPLKEYNEEVLRVSLTWAVFDYIAANFVIPWEVERRGRYTSVSGGDTFKPRSPSSDNDSAKLTHIMSARTTDLNLDSEQTQLAVLDTIAHDYRSDIESHLQSILDHGYCPKCSQKYPREDADNECQTTGCNGSINDAIEMFSDTISEAVDEFADRYLKSYDMYLNELNGKLDDLIEGANQAKKAKRKTSSREKATELRKDQEALLDRQSALKDRIERIKSLSYVDFLRESRQSRYAFDMRTISDSVAVSLVDTNDDEYITRSLGDDDGRAIEMAISELHPGAAYLDDGDPYVVTQLGVDEYRSSEIRQQVRDAKDTPIAEEFICPNCRTTHEQSGTDCECDGDSSISRRRLVSPDSVTAHRSDLLMSSGTDAARTVYDEPKNEIQNTYAERETSVLSFDPIETYAIKSADGYKTGTLDFGSYTVIVHTSNYQAKYKNGQVDTQPNLFELCGAQDCTGTVYYDQEDTPHCSVNDNHDPLGEEGSEYVRLGHVYETNGVRVDVGKAEQSHVLTHGFRLALQYLGGVSIRDLTEVTYGEQSSKVDLFDSQEGGSGVTRLLVDQSNSGTSNFITAIELMKDHLECDCDGGCPLCVYQYGCDKQNRSDTFDLGGIIHLLTENELTLVERDVDQ